MKVRVKESPSKKHKKPPPPPPLPGTAVSTRGRTTSSPPVKKPTLTTSSSPSNSSSSSSSSSTKQPLSRADSVMSAISLAPTMQLQQRQQQRPPSSSSNTSLTRVYRTRQPRPFSIDTSRARSNQPVVSLCARKIGIQEHAEGRDDGRPCDVYWHNVVYSDMRFVVTSAQSHVNKFPGMTELARKISLTHSMTSMQRLFPHEYAFYPKSWFLPAHLDEFRSFCREKGGGRRRSDESNGSDSNEERWFIVKPDDGAQGTGIYLISDASQLRSLTERQLVQEYVADPFLMADQLKFDFRVYGVIKSLNPLSIYVAREGMARFCTERYVRPTRGNMTNLFAHLTNYSLNKSSDAYVHSSTLQDQTKGSKRLLSTVFHQMEARGLKTKRLWHDIKLIIVKTVLAMLPEIILHYEHHFYDSAGPQCFQIIGFDVMVRASGEAMLLEVNAAPSLSIDHLVPVDTIDGGDVAEAAQKVRSVVDEVIKIPLVRDTLLLVLNLLDEEYNNGGGKSSASASSASSGMPGARADDAAMTQDDMSTLRTRRRPHLSEIFPTRYGQHSGHLLFLDKAVYLFMQFVNLRQTVNVTLTGLRQFIKKCGLSTVVTIQEVEEKAAEINYYFTGDPTTLANGLCFHAFLMLLHFLAERKFGVSFKAPSGSGGFLVGAGGGGANENELVLLGRMQRLLAFCDTALRHYGVRSARLRRTEVGTNDEENPVELYMLPSRVRRGGKGRSRSQKAGAGGVGGGGVDSGTAAVANRLRRAKHNLRPPPAAAAATAADRNNNAASTSSFSLPRITVP